MIGRSIGNYKIVRVLGEGGMGTVYLAEHPMIGKRVAVKVLRPDLSSDPGLISRFFQEAKAVNAIRHPNIVDITDFGHTEDGIVYFVMEVMEGRSLRDELASKGPLPIPLAITVAKQIVDALAAAHRMRIIHRDLKPDNIFLLPDPQTSGEIRAKLFDFGIAKLVGDNRVGHKTIDGAVVGTPFYMSPEQALCQEVGAAADIYAMGVVMFEMLTGIVPFRSQQLVLLLNAILKEVPPHARQLRPDAPLWLDRLIHHCLEKDPEARPLRMEDIHTQLVVGETDLPSDDVMLGATLVGRPDLPSGPAQSPHGPLEVRPQGGLQNPLQITLPARSHARTFSEEAKRPAPSANAPVAHSAEPTSSFWRRINTRIGLSLLALTVVAVIAMVVVRSQKPVIPIAPMAETPAPEKPTVVNIRLHSTPAGAEVTRLSDNRALGTTPLVDSRKPDGHVVSYRFHLAGHTDIQIPFQAQTAGDFELTAALTPHEKRTESGGRSAASKGTKSKSKDPVIKPILAAPTPVASPARSDRPISSDQNLPPLGERNPIKRLRH